VWPVVVVEDDGGDQRAGRVEITKKSFFFWVFWKKKIIFRYHSGIYTISCPKDMFSKISVDL